MGITFRNFLRTAFITVLSFTATAQAQQPLQNSLLWKITGNGLSKPSYLYGTIHMICEDDFYISPETKEAFASSDKLVLETNLFDPKVLFAVQKLMMSDTPQSKRLSPAMYAEMDSLLKVKTGTSLSQFDNFKLSAIVSILSMKAFSCTNPKSYEAEFNKMALAEKKEITGLETMQEQMDYLNKAFTDEATLAHLKAFDEQKANLGDMLKHYKAGDLEQLHQLITDDKVMDKSTLELLVYQRNANWAAKMPEMMKDSSGFFAVGAGHLGGSRGLIELLRSKGYIVTPVIN